MVIQGPSLRFRFSNGQDESNCVLLDGEQDTDSILVSTKNTGTEDTQTVCVHIFYGLIIGRTPDSRPEVAGSNLAYNQPTSGCQRLSGEVSRRQGRRRHICPLHRMTPKHADCGEGLVNSQRQAGDPWRPSWLFIIHKWWLSVKTTYCAVGCSLRGGREDHISRYVQYYLDLLKMCYVPIWIFNKDALTACLLNYLSIYYV
jgi:hypothetical protein